MKLSMGYFALSGVKYPSPTDLECMVGDYDRLERSLGDNPNAIADCMGWTRGTGCVVRRMAHERRAAA